MSTTAKLNWLRAGVLGANDGIVSVAALVVGVAAATTDVNVLLISGVAAVVAGAVSMALGEYVSVSTQRDTEEAMVAAGHLAPMEAHELVNPWHAAWASALAFTSGAVLPMIAVLLPPAEWRIPLTVVAVLIALTATGAISAHMGGAKKMRAIFRVTIGGGIALFVTWAIGALLGVGIA